MSESKIKTVYNDNKEDLYVSWNQHDKLQINRAMKAMSGAVDSYEGVHRSTASHFRRRTSLEDIGGTDIHGRRGLTSHDYDLFRPHEAKASDPQELKIQADILYRNVGILKNVIDLMGDFTAQGIRLTHPNKKIENFYKNWWEQVNGAERSERFCNILYRLGTVVARRQTAKLNLKKQQEFTKAKGSPDMDIKDPEVFKREIPWKYTFLHPAAIIMVGGVLGNFSGSPKYALKLSSSLRRLISNPKGKEEKEIVNSLPQEIISASKTSNPILLDSNKLSVWNYKKDDWQEWGDPVAGAIIEDLSILKKLKLADKAALDGAVSNIRIFKIGSLEHKIAPTSAAAAKLADILQSHTGSGTMDLIWGPDIEMIESKTNVHEFLGEEKYKPTLMNIYSGLGIPPTLTGTFGNTGTTNNFISLKTLIQRLIYGRKQLERFWTQEIKAVQKAMGFRFPAKIEFDLLNLGDEEAEKNLLIKMVEHNLISHESAQFKLGTDPNTERIRLNRESRERESGQRVPQAGPYHNPQFGHELKKLALQTGVVTPHQVGLREEERRPHLKMYPKKKDDKNALEMRSSDNSGGNNPSNNKKGVPGQGRPPGKKDSEKRKPKDFKPKTRATIEVWAKFAQEAISEYVNPLYLENIGKKNMRSLSSQQFEDIELLKFGVLSNLEPLSEISEETVLSAMEKPMPTIIKTTYSYWKQEVESSLSRTLSVDETRILQASVYATCIDMENL